MHRLLARTANQGLTHSSVIQSKHVKISHSFCTLASSSSSFTPAINGTIPHKPLTVNNTSPSPSPITRPSKSRYKKITEVKDFKTLEKNYPYVPAVPDLSVLSDADAQVAYDVWVDRLKY